MSDDDIWRLQRGGHDPQKVYAAFHRANNHKGQPTVLLIKTVKGFGMGKSGEGKNTAHQTKKLIDEDVRAFRDRFNMPIPDDQLAEIPFYKPADDTPEMRYLHERRKALGGYLPHRRTKADEQLKVPRARHLQGRCSRPPPKAARSRTTQAYVRFLTQLLRDKEIGPRTVPILVDEARTFGMEGLFRQIGIYNPEGQKYTPVDKDQVMYYREDKAGQILQEGINEAGGMSSWIAAATSYSTNNRIMIPFYIYYSMFGLQRVGDLCLGGGRHAGARLPARRHVGPHHAQRRRPAARRRPQPHAGRHHPQLRQLRPDLRARGRRDHAPRPEAHGREAGERLLLPDAAERELPDARPASRHRRADHQGHVPAAGRRQEDAARQPARLGHDPARVDGGQGAAREANGAWPPTSGAARASTSWRATARIASAGTCCTRTRSRACRS